MQISKWAEVREEKKREKTHLTSVRVWVELRWIVGGRRTFDEVWGGAVSLCHRCVGMELKGFVVVTFSWNWNWIWRACEAKGCEFWGKRKRRERISWLKK